MAAIDRQKEEVLKTNKVSPTQVLLYMRVALFLNWIIYHMLKHIKVVFVLGGPGSGKHTQCQLIEKKFKWKHISAGHLLRDEIRNPLSKYGGVIEEIIYDGKIVPSHITTKLLHETIQNNQNEVTKFLIDGYPRNLENLTSWINESKDFCDTSFILHFRCSEEEMIKRVLNRAE